MKLIILLLLITSQIFAYNSYYNQHLANKNQIENRKLNIEHYKYLQEQKDAEKRRYKNEVKNRNAKAKLANERHYRELEYKNRNNQYNQSPSLIIEKEKYNPVKFKNTPQIKLGKLHIYGITSIEVFKKDKWMIKGSNGTFALPKDKFEEAEKINFNSDLMK